MNSLKQFNILISKLNATSAQYPFLKILSSLTFLSQNSILPLPDLHDKQKERTQDFIKKLPPPPDFS